ncbi:prolyl aminopeptidase [Actinokineospora sp. NBRC 105648]|uniref:prolyl aminopeptidase n=1 Tax=Actinokineospora sp. NBRC 105648 TaxID=3032206 RepID=UPI0024A008E1|nr:prolyl aminopeptidase [Actinokineospora sp. NBRC 105648]GLZ43405.1 proline iminopeptidase [Actinokineospora sp. NBRC 105648]
MYPASEPYAHGMLDVGDGNQVYWEECGNPAGKPALFVHGGPGWGASPVRRRYFDPFRYRAILFDQRGCGRSTPHASDPSADMSVNTTQHLLADMELLREHLGVSRWLLFGGSWGSTLILAYAQQFAAHVSEVVIAGVTTSRRSELDWLYRGVGSVLPEAWERFRAGLPADDLLNAYAQLMEDPDPAVRLSTANRWSAWEDAVLSTEPSGLSTAFQDRTEAERLALVRICAHYFSHGCWLADALPDPAKLVGIPAVLIHGAHDLSGLPGIAQEVADSWPGAELDIIGDSGHTGSTTMSDHIVAALDRFAR